MQTYLIVSFVFLIPSIILRCAGCWYGKALHGIYFHDVIIQPSHGTLLTLNSNTSFIIIDSETMYIAPLSMQGQYSQGYAQQGYVQPQPYPQGAQQGYMQQQPAGIPQQGQGYGYVPPQAGAIPQAQPYQGGQGQPYV